MLKLQAEFTNMLALTEITEPPAGCHLTRNIAPRILLD